MKNGTFFYTDNTEKLYNEALKLEKALERVAGKATPTSAMIRKLRSHIALLDSEVFHMKEIVEQAPKFEPVTLAGTYYRKVK